MTTYEIQVVHEPTGEVMNFAYESDKIISDEDILKDLTIEIFEEVPYEELHMIDIEIQKEREQE